jgi:hypothetical protein
MIFNPYAWAAGLALMIAVALGGVQTGRKLERSTWQARELAAAKQHAYDLAAAAEQIQRAHNFNNAKARKASEDHAKALSDLSSKYAADLAAIRTAGGLRIPASACASAAQSASAGRPDESSAATVQLPERIESGLFALTKRADELAEQLRALQGWVRDNGHYGDSNAKETAR